MLNAAFTPAPQSEIPNVMPWSLETATAFLEMSSDGFLVLAETGKVLSFSKGFLRLIGASNELAEVEIIKLIHPRDRKDFAAAILNRRIRPASTLDFAPLRNSFRILHGSGSYLIAQFERKPDTVNGAILCRVTQDTAQALGTSLVTEFETALGVGTWEIDLTTNELHWSEVTHQIHDTNSAIYKPKLADGLTFFHEESIPILTAAVDDLVQHGQPYDLRLRFVSAKGRNRWVRTTATAKKFGNEVIRVYGTFEDITEEFEQVRTLARFKEIVDLAQEGIVEIDCTGQVTYANSKLATMLDLPVQQLLGQPFLRFVAPEQRQNARELLLYSGDVQGNLRDFKLVTATGKNVWSRFSVRRQCDPAGPLHYAIALVTDISQDRRREEKLLNTNERMSSIINNAPVMLAFCDQNGRFEWTNDLWIRELGWPVTSMNRTELFENLFSDPDQRNKALDFLDHADASWQDFTIRTRTNALLHTSWAAVPLSSGRKIVICQNINARKNLEIENEMNRSRLDFILEGAALGAWDWDLTTNTVTFDRRWCEMLGLRHEETPQMLSTWDARVHPEDKQQTYNDINLHLLGKTVYYENVHRMKHTNGEWLYILDRGRISERDANGKAIRFTGTHFNITKQKLLEIENRMIIDVIGVGIWQFNPITNTLIWDKSMYQLYEINAADFKGDVDAWKNSLTDESRDRTADLLQQALDGTAEFNTVFQIRTRSGKIKSIEARGKVIRDANGKATMMYGLNWDKSNEVELQASLEAARVKSIQSAKLALLGEMAGGIAHEINNPLTIILGKTEQVMRLVRKSPLDVDKIEASLGVVIRTSDRIAKIVRGLKSFARQSDNDPKQLEQVSVILEETLELCRERFRNHNVELRYEPKSDGRISCRPAQISQVVMNLLSNAFDAIQNQEVKWVKLELDSTSSDVTISVTDSGNGIKPEIVNNLMQPFFTTKEVGKGTGLGLSIARTIAEEHDAQFYYDQTSQNTRFVLRLPRVVLPIAEDPAAPNVMED
jgi:PAS domain S-box-containing protein